MDDLIVTFLETHHPFEYQNEVYRSFKLLEGFEYPNLYSNYIDILSNESYTSTEQLIDDFDIMMHRQLNTVLDHHRITLVDDASHIQKNEILSALLTLQTLDDYTPVMMVLESLETSEEKISLLLEDYCSMDQTEIISIIADFNSITLENLKQYIISKEQLERESIDYQVLLPRLKQLFKLHGKDNIGYQLIQQDVKPGYPLEIYLELTENNFDKTPINILSLLLMTLESQTSPIELFRKYSEMLIKDIRQIPAIEASILQLLNTLDEHVRAQALVNKS